MQELHLTRTFDAPREKVWKAFTTAEHLNHWWGPKGFEMNTLHLDLRPEGIFHYSMTSPDGNRMWGKFVYKEVQAPEKLVFINCFSDENGGTTRNPWNPKWPLEIINYLTLEEAEGKTILTLKGGPINATEEEMKAYEEGIAGMQQGFGGTFDALEAYLPQV